MGQYITDIFEINRDINLRFRESKLPFFLQKRITRKRRKKIIEIINKIRDFEVIPGELIKEYITHVYNAYSPNGKYRKCLKVEPIDITSTELSALFKIPINDENNVYGVVTLSPDSFQNSYTIRFMWINNGSTVFTYAEDNIHELINHKFYEKDSYPYSAKNENKIIHDLFCKYLIDDIYHFLMDEIERSERMTEEYGELKIK